MKRLRYLGLVTLLAVMTCNTSGQTVRQKDRVISGNANLSRLNKEGTEAVKDDRLREVLLDSSVNAVILQDRTPGGATASPWYGWHAFRRGLATNLHRLGVSDKVIQQILRHANVTTTINIYVKMVTRDAEEAMKKLESNCSLVVPQTVPQLTFESAKLGAAMENSSGCKTLTLEAVRGNLAERGGFEPPVGVLAPTTV
jgi:hypothetical protein